MGRAAARPAGPGLGRDDDGPAFAVRVGDRGGGAGCDADYAAGQGQKDGLGQELGADLASGGAERAAQPDLGAALEDGNDHDIGHHDGADDQRDSAEAEEQGVEGAVGVGLLMSPRYKRSEPGWFLKHHASCLGGVAAPTRAPEQLVCAVRLLERSCDRRSTTGPPRAGFWTLVLCYTRRG
jgi:hypothetical protein